ncbi:strawberry notch-like NTP hydrolase domain-containing protein [Sphingobium sp. DC-2]|uniref:strawberry notch-like NTP hydrolase domain-containing protein n=1 Tax=Sphingobium sp. DC-2 TaxID=1303256 RepID=UPI0004C3C29C|nr:strawberry notch family protein [Sphingobium sp. DC-2]
MRDLLDLPPVNDRSAARHIAALLAEGALITRRDLNEAMTRCFGGSDADGRWTQRASFEMLEHALALHLRTRPHALDGLADVAAATALMERCPTQTVRSEEQIVFQQFSTPADIAALAVLLAAITLEDIVLEPSAGNGLLAAQIPPSSALYLNEIDAKRRERLASVFPDAIVTGHDGAGLVSLHAALPRPSVVLINPPFARSLGRGADDLAALRHLQAALRRLRPGGRAVAVMPDWFAPDTRVRAAYEAVLSGCSVRTSLRLEHCYRKHGTDIAVRLYVIDKGTAAGEEDMRPATIARASLADLIDAVTIPPRAPLPDTGASSVISSAPSSLSSTSAHKPATMFGAARSAKAAKPRPFHAPLKNAVLPVAYRTLEQAAPLAEQVGVYLPYRPSRIVFETAGEHPTALVESVAMGSIPAPIPTHVPHLPERTVTERLLSTSQLETVVYAGHAWSQMLPGTFRAAETGVGLIIDPEGRQYRKGFFLGDGTGAGKGRQIAACILDNWLQGRRRHVFVTKNEPLLEDFRRDWTALGGLSADVQPLSNWKIDQPVSLEQGVLFVTYPTLRSGRSDHTRLQQILDWAGSDFEGVIAFDEAHEMGGVAGGEGALGRKEGSQQGVAGVLLQNRLPGARVLYASATGASDVNNFAYAVRLGLWGPETAFANREAFISEIRQGGIAAMELVVRDLKALGLYTARALSFAGVEYDVLRHALTPAQIEIYDTYASAWHVILSNMEAALEQTGVVDGFGGKTLNAGAKAAARSRIESVKQRFFGAVLLAMKLPTVIAAVEEHLKAGQSVVLQLVTTAEAILDRRLSQMSAEERADPMLTLSPVDQIVDYLMRAFPTRQMRVFTDDTGTVRSEPMSDENGNPVHNPEAIAARDGLIETICALPPIQSALDAIVEHFGPERVAEVTGRSKRLVTLADGRQKVESRPASASRSESSAFMDGTKRVLVFSDAGGTGRSYHASLDAVNQEQRVHFLLEPGWRADRAIQGLGRTHRTHQASTPLFRPVTTDCKGELRFTSTIARRLDSLGALTRGQRQTGGQNLFDPGDNLESEYARDALVTWFHLLDQGKLKSTTLDAFTTMTGLEIHDGDGVMKEELPPIQRWLNRLLALPIGMQNEIFEEFLALVETRVAAARDAGTLDVGVETIMADSATVIDDTLLRTDPNTGATSHLLTIEIARRKNPIALERILKIADAHKDAAFVHNGRSGKVALRLRARPWMDEEGEPIARVELQRPCRREFLREADLLESAWDVIDRDAFATLWSAEHAEAAEQLDVETIRLATGLLLPIWSALPSDHLAVNRIVDKSGNSWLGRLVFDDHVVHLYTKLGIARSEDMPTDAIARSVLSGRSVAVARPFAMTFKRSLVNGNPRVEIVDAPANQLPWLKSLGCFVEIIQYRSRVFVPVNDAESVIGAIIKAA